MFRNRTRKRIKEHNWNDHSNTSQFFSRIEEQTDEAIKDLTLVANNLNEKQLEKIFTIEKLEPFIQSLMLPKKIEDENYRNLSSQRLFFLGHMLMKYSLNLMGTTFGNKWAKELYQQHEIPLSNMLDTIYYEKKNMISQII